VELLVNDSPRRSHPLDVSFPDHALVPLVIAVLHLALERNRHGLEAPVRVLPHALGLALVAREVLRSSIIEHNEGRELGGEGLVSKHREDIKPVSHPVLPRTPEDLLD
jgi:hypothetical protein